MMYPEPLLIPMRQELTRLGIEELRTAEAVDALLKDQKGTAMVVVIWAGAMALQPWLQSHGWRYPALGGLIGFGIVTYFAAGFALRAFRMSELKGLRRKG